MNLGKAIKLCRTQKNLSQVQLAELANVSVSYVSLLERNKRDPNLSAVQKIAEAMEIPFSILIFLAADRDELEDISPELAEKLSYTALKLIESTTHETPDLSR